MRFYPESEVAVGNPNRSQRIMPDKGLFLNAEKKKKSALCAYLLAISLSPDHSCFVPRNRQDYRGGIFGQGPNGPALAKPDVSVRILV